MERLWPSETCGDLEMDSYRKMGGGSKPRNPLFQAETLLRKVPVSETGFT
jgi:hypothetical protein